MRLRFAGAALAVAAAVLAGCSSGDAAPPQGEMRPLGFGVSQRIELFVPEGWDMVNQDDLTAADPTDPLGSNGVTYALLDRSRIPEQLSEAVVEDDEARARFADAALGGAAVVAQFTELTPCDSVRSLLQDRRRSVDFEALDDRDHGLGEDRKLGVAARESDGAQYRYVQYYASVPLTESNCVGVVLESTLRGPDGDTVDAARGVVTDIADQSRVDELEMPGD